MGDDSIDGRFSSEGISCSGASRYLNPRRIPTSLRNLLWTPSIASLRPDRHPIPGRHGKVQEQARDGKCECEPVSIDTLLIAHTYAVSSPTKLNHRAYYPRH
ncbi:hypothetical protein J6590_026746 [Homalodisca vitripennis]|nr:hypothetical protein J6590_026746 [Homalodisca vitripennis]